MFITFDGIDGTGKSTQVRLFCQWLEQLGRPFLACRDPGSTPLGEQLRGLLLGDHACRIDRRSEMLIYMAARAQLVDELIRPALLAGQIVVCDRFLLANVVYQAYAGGLDVEQTWTVGHVATGGLSPTITFLLDMEVEQAFARLRRQPDRMEARGLEYLQRVRQGFLTEQEKLPDQILRIDAQGTPEEVQDRIRALAGQHLDLRR